MENIEAFIQAGAAAVGVGGEMVPKGLLARREFGEITKRAREFADAVARARAAGDGPVVSFKVDRG